MHNDQIERAIEGVFSGYEQEQKLTGAQTLDIVLATLSALVRALSKRSIEGKTSGARADFLADGRILNLGLERAICHNLGFLQQTIMQIECEENQE